MRILIVDDHICIMMGIARLLEDSGHFQLVGMTSTGKKALALVKSNEVDLVLLDIELSNGENGFSLIKKIKNYADTIKVVIFSAHNSYIYLNKAMEMGADEFISKSSDYFELESVLKGVHSGKSWFTRSTSGLQKYTLLSKKEESVIAYLAKGIPQKQIADTLNVKPSTVATFVQRAKRKLGVSSIPELVSSVRLIN